MFAVGGSDPYPKYKAGTEGGQGSEEVPITCHGDKTLPSHAAKILRQLLTFVKNGWD